MSLIARVRSWLRVSSQRAQFEREMQDEMRTHLELYQADLRRRGVPEEEARRRALAEFGSVAARREECREEVGLRLLDELRGDVSYACRLLRRSPAFTLVALLSLGLGIGANTAIFTLIDTVLVKTLPVEDPQRLFFVDNSGGKSGGSNGPPYPCFERLRDHNRFLSGIAAFSGRMFKVSIDSVPERVRGQYASGSYFDVLGVRAVHGRMLTPADDSEPGRGGAHGAVAVISDGFWTRRFGRDPAVSREERSGRHAVGDHRRRYATGILRASGRRADRHHASHDARRTGAAIETELVAERDRSSRTRRERRGGACGSRGAVGCLLDGSRDASRQARLFQRHRAGARGQRRERVAPHLRGAADDRDGDRRRCTAHRLRQCGQPAARPRHREAERDGGAARDWREPWQADPSVADRGCRPGVAGCRSRVAVRALGRVVPGCGSLRTRRTGGVGAAFRPARVGLYRRRFSRDRAALQPRSGAARDARRCRETRRCRWNDDAEPSRSSAGRRSSHLVGPPALRRRALSANASQPEHSFVGFRSRGRVDDAGRGHGAGPDGPGEDSRRVSRRPCAARRDLARLHGAGAARCRVYLPPALLRV